MTSRTFEIGQVVYILSEQAQTILPGMVVEECVVKKLSGNSVSWKIKVGAGDNAKLFDSAKIKGEVYGSLEEVRVVMTERLTGFIVTLTQAAEARVEKWYGKEIADREKANVGYAAPSSDPDDKLDPDMLLNSIENTSTPTPKFSSEVPRMVQHQPTSSADMREKLRNLATPPPEEGDQQASEGTMFMIDAGGARIPVKMKV